MWIVEIYNMGGTIVHRVELGDSFEVDQARHGLFRQECRKFKASHAPGQYQAGLFYEKEEESGIYETISISGKL